MATRIDAFVADTGQVVPNVLINSSVEHTGQEIRQPCGKDDYRVLSCVLMMTLDAKSSPMRVTSGKSRVRESRLPGICEGEAEWPSYSTTTRPCSDQR